MVLAVASTLLATVVLATRSGVNLEKQILSLLPASNRLIQKVVLY